MTGLRCLRSDAFFKSMTLVIAIFNVGAVVARFLHIYAVECSKPYRLVALSSG